MYIVNAPVLAWFRAATADALVGWPIEYAYIRLPIFQRLTRLEHMAWALSRLPCMPAMRKPRARLALISTMEWKSVAMLGLIAAFVLLQLFQGLRPAPSRSQRSDRTQ
jgi:hypothetical protein